MRARLLVPFLCTIIDTNIVTGRQGVYNMGRNFSVKVGK